MTPSILTSEEIEKLLDNILENYDLSNLKEFTFEAGRIDTLNREKIINIKKHIKDKLFTSPVDKISILNCSTVEIFPTLFQGESNPKAIEDIIKAGTVVYIIFLIWSNKSTPTILAAIPVVSESGDILSPKNEPETIAPAVIAGLKSKAFDIPIRATPSVATVVKLLPIAIPIIAVIKKEER